MVRYEDKCETKYETKCETQYDSVCNDVQVPLQVAATLSEWKRFQDFIFRTRHAQPSTKLNAKRFSDKNLFHILDDDDDDDVKVYEDKCSVTYETAYEEQCRTEQEQVSQDDNGDGDDDCHRHDRLVCPADDGLGHEDSDNGDDDIIENESE